MLSEGQLRHILLQAILPDSHSLKTVSTVASGMLAPAGETASEFSISHHSSYRMFRGSYVDRPNPLAPQYPSVLARDVIT